MEDVPSQPVVSPVEISSIPDGVLAYFEQILRSEMLDHFVLKHSSAYDVPAPTSIRVDCTSSSSVILHHTCLMGSDEAGGESLFIVSPIFCPSFSRPYGEEQNTSPKNGQIAKHKTAHIVGLKQDPRPIMIEIPSYPLCMRFRVSSTPSLLSDLFLPFFPLCSCIDHLNNVVGLVRRVGREQDKGASVDRARRVSWRAEYDFLCATFHATSSTTQRHIQDWHTHNTQSIRRSPKQPYQDLQAKRGGLCCGQEPALPLCPVVCVHVLFLPFESKAFNQIKCERGGGGERKTKVCTQYHGKATLNKTRSKSRFLPNKIVFCSSLWCVREYVTVLSTAWKWFATPRSGLLRRWVFCTTVVRPVTLGISYVEILNTAVMSL